MRVLISAHVCSKMQAKEEDAGGKIGVKVPAFSAPFWRTNHVFSGRLIHESDRPVSILQRSSAASTTYFLSILRGIIMSGKYRAPQPELLAPMREKLAGGISLSPACRSVGISQDVVYAWARQCPEWRQLCQDFRKTKVSLYGATWLPGRN